MKYSIPAESYIFSHSVDDSLWESSQFSESFHHAEYWIMALATKVALQSKKLTKNNLSILYSNLNIKFF